MRHLVLPLALLAACSTAPQHAPTPSDSELKRRVDAALESAIKEHRVIGAVVLIAEDGKLVYHRAIGQIDREENIAMPENAVFRLASVTKPITALTAMQLVRNGDLELDAPVTKYLPKFEPHMPDGTAPVITIRQLLTHTSGLSYPFLQPANGPYEIEQVSSGLDYPGRSFSEQDERLVRVPLVALPGTAFNYSLGFDVLGEVMTRAAKSSLPEIVARTVTEPLAMNDTAYTVHDPSRLAVPYVTAMVAPKRMDDTEMVTLGVSPTAFNPIRIFDSRSFPSGGGGMAGSASDVLTLLEAIRTGDSRVISADMQKAALSDQLGDADTRNLGPGLGFTFIGSIVRDPTAAGTPANIGTVRWGGVYGHSWLVDPVAKLTVVALTNTTPEGMSGQLPKDLEHAVYGR